MATYLVSLTISLIILGVGLSLTDSFYQLFYHFPMLALFLAITLYQLSKNILNQYVNIQITSISLILLLGLFIGYLYLVVGYDSALQAAFPTINTPLIAHFQYEAIAGLLIFYSLYLYIKYNKPQCYIISYINYLITQKLFIEEIYRHCLLQPMRDAGDILYQFFVQKKAIAVFSVGLMLLSNMINHLDSVVSPLLSNGFDLIGLMIFLLTANRARELKHILLFLALSQFTLALIASQVMSANAIKIAYFQLINTSLLSLLMVMILHKIKTGEKLMHRIDNNLPWLGAYLTALLFCLIGLPFTPTFISEVIILKETLVINPLLAIAVLIAIVLFAISILHTLQDYIFKGSAIERLSIRLSKLEHLLFTGILLFNFLNGLYPSYTLRFL